MRTKPWTKSRQLIAGTVIFVSSGIGAYAFLTMEQRGLRRPFLLQAVVRQRQPDGSYRQIQTLTQAVRTDGSEILETAPASGGASAPRLRELWLTPTKTYWKYDPATHSTTSQPIDAIGMARLTATPGSGCLAAHGNPSGATCAATGENFHGYAVWKLSQGIQAPDGDWMQTEQLVAPDLQWSTLKLSKYKDAVVVEEQDTVSLVEGEAAAALFQPLHGSTVLSLADYLDLSLRPRTYTVNAAMLSGEAPKTPPAEPIQAAQTDTTPDPAPSHALHTRRLAKNAAAGSADRMVAPEPARATASQKGLRSRVWRRSVKAFHHVFSRAPHSSGKKE